MLLKTGGTSTPQLLVANLLKQVFKHSGISVCGGDESVFGTNTTSKKPADIWLESNNRVTALFEVTLKKVDHKRLEDLLESTRTLNFELIPITFICRIPEDISTLNGINGNTLSYKGRQIEFVDYAEFIRTGFALIDAAAAGEIHDTIQGFVKKVTTTIATKDVWNKVFKAIL